MKTPSFKTEVDLCAKFLADVAAMKKGDRWTPYNETQGWDILLVRDADGFQIGIQAKLKLNADVVSQALEDGHSWLVDRAGPDCRAVLVPHDAGGNFSRICAYIGLTIIYVSARSDSWNIGFNPGLPQISDTNWWNGAWVEMATARRHKLPEYVPDVAAGAAAPLQLTAWKIAAIKIAVTLDLRGYVTRADFKAHKIDHRRWIASEGGWLRPWNGVYVAGDYPPNVSLRAQHPRVYAEITADADKWLPASAGEQLRLKETTA